MTPTFPLSLGSHWNLINRVVVPLLSMARRELAPCQTLDTRSPATATYTASGPRTPSPPPVTHIAVVLNWFAELKTKAPPR